MTTGVYFKECGDFEKDKRKLIEFVKNILVMPSMT